MGISRGPPRRDGNRPAFSWSPGTVTQLPDLRLRLLQPVRHPHLAVHRCRSGQVLRRPLALARALVELAEAAVAVSDERAHAELFCENYRLAAVGFDLRHGGGR